jgi:hypothetical protein
LSAVPACGTTSTITITGTSTNNSEFFDPGPGYNRLSVSVSGGSGGVTVGNINFVNPTKFTADFTVPSNASGTYTVTVTNPDGQTSSTTFDANCSGTSCAAPTGLSAAVSSNSATLSWTGTLGATYDVDYSVAGANSWNNVATGTTSTSVTASNLSSSTNYDWRVLAHCSGGGTSGYATGKFTTTGAITSCDAPTNLTATAITGSSATVSWTATSGAISYDVDYSVTGANSWINVATSTTLTSVNITGLNSSQSYDWRVRTNCSSGSSSYATSQFTTTCDGYEPNNTLATATPISTGSITAQIATLGDVDYYSFSTAGNQKNAQVILSGIPAGLNYYLVLYDNNGNQLKASAVPGASTQTVFYNNKKPSTYYVKVYGASSSDYSATACYTLTVNTSSNTYTAAVASSAFNKNLLNAGLKVYPVPASNTVTVSFDGVTTTSASITFINEIGQPVLVKNLQSHPGTNINTLDVSALQQGIYTVKVNNGTDIQTTKLIISK